MASLPSDLRLWNQRQVLDYLLREGPATRSTVSQALPMSAPTVGKLIGELISTDVIEELDAETTVGRSSLGRPGRLLRVDRRLPRFILVQLGIRQTRLMMVPLGLDEDSVEWQVVFPTGESASDWVVRLKAAAVDMPAIEPWGVIVSVPGVVDEIAGQVLYSPNLRWLADTNLPTLIEEVWPAPICLVQEIRALALGELMVTGERDFLLVDVGDGLGAAAVIGGRLFEGLSPMSGELGHTRVPGCDRRCGCGAVGCLETLVSRGGLVRSLAEVQGESEVETQWQAVVEQVRLQGVAPWLNTALARAAEGIGGAVNVLGLRQVVVTGALAELGWPVIEQLSIEVQRSTLWGQFEEVRVVASPRRRAQGLVLAGINRFVAPLPAWQELGEAQSVEQSGINPPLIG